MTPLDLILALPFSDLLTFLLFFVLLDVPRYLLAAIVTPFLRPPPVATHSIARVTGIIPCHNEERALPHCVQSMRANGVNQIIVVNDGSTDATASVAASLGVTVIGLLERQGKPDAINHALPSVNGEFVLVADADTTFAPGSLVRALSYFADHSVGGVGFHLTPSNPHTTMATSVQAIEYAFSFGPARQLADMLGILSNVSGAAGIFRTRALDEVEGWDMEVAEDAALAMRLRAHGWTLRYAANAGAQTVVPTTMPALLLQRLRWDASIVTIWGRKFAWMLSPFVSPINLSNTLTVLDVLTFNAIMPIILPVYLFWMFDRAGAGVADIFVASVMALATADLFLAILIGLPPRLLIYWPWYFVVSLFVLRPLRIIAILGELVFRISHYDPYIPAHQRSRLS